MQEIACEMECISTDLLEVCNAEHADSRGTTSTPCLRSQDKLITELSTPSHLLLHLTGNQRCRNGTLNRRLVGDCTAQDLNSHTLQPLGRGHHTSQRGTVVLHCPHCVWLLRLSSLCRDKDDDEEEPVERGSNAPKFPYNPPPEVQQIHFMDGTHSSSRLHAFMLS
ncbi:uncharacterized protein LY89DRAFT_379347 [Mollisia scopiformis]|uniref:Uncharacterized protein n=1 Tax=Mollisia scopiformis TaxID=149040 RepID=A0A194XPI8_MOLSC|nr:uncharacterized protein LY89DRAFT_379347 [Mollisia scopiformis]KUJ21652.1 hypothetical protein LY89DRAFT_379347 [Mollisia scopiformis]